MSTALLQDSSTAAPTSGDRDRIFFPALNAIRAYAAISVVIWHMYQLMIYYHVPIAEPLHDALSHAFLRGEDAVMLFFVLSGFLITYLLLAEQRRTGTISVAKFYVRRILRIWPLYYLLILLGFLVIPLCVGWKNYTFLPVDGKFLPRLGLFLLMLPNLSEAIWPGAIPIAHLWSIGVEEQFYLIWPALMKCFARYTLLVILAVIGLKLYSFYLDDSLTMSTRHWRRGDWAPELKILFDFLRLLRLDAMAVGGLAAYLAMHATRLPDFNRYLYHPLTAFAALALMIWSIVTMYQPVRQYFGVLHAGIYAFFILCVGANPRLPRWLLLAPVDYLGRISYGIYMYHVAVMFCLLRYLQRHEATWHTGFTYLPRAHHSPTIIAPAQPSPLRNLALLLVILALTTAVASASFYFFERPFLKLKRRYTIVKSGSPESAAVA